MRIEMEGARERIVALRVRDAEGDSLPIRNVQLEDNPSRISPRGLEPARPGFQAVFEVAATDDATPAALEVLYALALEERPQLFVVELPAADSQVAASTSR
jgi:hypothetical protein